MIISASHSLSKNCWHACERCCAGPPTCRPKRSTLGRLSFDAGSRQANIDGKAFDLPRRELLVLETLLRRMGRTVPRSALEDAVYSFDDEIQSNALDTHISRLRRKLSEADAGIEIHAIRGVGYLLKRLS